MTDVPQKNPPQLMTVMCPHCHNLETMQVFEEEGKQRFVCMACRWQWEDRRTRPRPGSRKILEET